MIKIKRIYESASDGDGTRILVDRLWPRGMDKQKSAIDLWLKDIAPSPELRKWFNHKPERFKEFSARYVSELDHNGFVEKLLDILSNDSDLTLIYAARDTKNNHAQVLLRYLKNIRRSVII